jgi:hypothetical protein
MDNEQEWRSYLIGEIKEIRSDLKEVKSEMFTLKVKVAAFSSIFASIATMIFNKIVGHS